MIIHKRQQMLSPVQSPVFRSKLAQQGMNDLKQVHAVKAAVQALITLIIGGGVKHAVIHQSVIIAMEHLTHQEEVLFQPAGKAAESAQEAFLKAIRHIQAQPVNVKLVHPVFHALQKIVHYFFIIKVQFHQIIIAFPAFIPKPVIIAGIALKRYLVEPIHIAGILTVAEYVLKRPKSSADMIEHTVQHYTDTVFMQSITHLLKILIGSQTHIHFAVVSGIIAVGIRLKQRRKIYRIDTHFFHMRYPVQHLQDSMLQYAVIFKGRSAEPQWVNLIKHTFICPHFVCLLFCSASASHGKLLLFLFCPQSIDRFSTIFVVF